MSKQTRTVSGLAVIALLLGPRMTLAHTPGLSVADFDLQADGRVQARLTFASAEALGGMPLDRDRDGVVTAEDVAAARDDLRSFVLQGVGVEADGVGCASTFRDASLTEVDGLVLEATYACPADPSELEVTLYYLSAMPRGVAHRGIARIVAGSATIEGVLTGDRRAIGLHLPGRAHAAARSSRWLAALAAAAVVGLLLGYRSRRWRAARAAWQNRAP